MSIIKRVFSKCPKFIFLLLPAMVLANSQEIPDGMTLMTSTGQLMNVALSSKSSTFVSFPGADTRGFYLFPDASTVVVSARHEHGERLYLWQYASNTVSDIDLSGYGKYLFDIIPGADEARLVFGITTLSESDYKEALSSNADTKTAFYEFNALTKSITPTTQASYQSLQNAGLHYTNHTVRPIFVSNARRFRSIISSIKQAKNFSFELNDTTVSVVCDAKHRMLINGANISLLNTAVTHEYPFTVSDEMEWLKLIQIVMWRGGGTHEPHDIISHALLQYYRSV